jgi:uncharacterized hydantoinase/oxoprolinase family protein
MRPPDRTIVGWDVGGAHVKACVLQGGEVVDVAQWACPLWQGLDQLERVLQQAHERWPAMGTMAHAVTMTGEWRLFAHREGVQRIAATIAPPARATSPATMAGATWASWPGAGPRSLPPAGWPPLSMPRSALTKACWSTSAAPPPT